MLSLLVWLRNGHGIVKGLWVDQDTRNQMAMNLKESAINSHVFISNDRNWLWRAWKQMFAHQS